MKNLKQKRILFLEDNVTFANDTIRFLSHYAKDVIHVESIEEALEKFHSQPIDIILSDLKVKDGIALSFIERIRKVNQQIPIAVLSAHKDEDLLLKAIPLGLTAYAIKPINFSAFEELLAKCSQALEILETNIIYVKDDTFYDKGKKTLIINNESIDLTKKESEFVELLLENKNSIVTKDMINEVIWDNEVMSDPALKNFLLRIRKKTYRDFFYTIQGIGYRLF
ncbi:MAG: response regulator transcription factor [Arcobacteraceae bacterium]